MICFIVFCFVVWMVLLLFVYVVVVVIVVFEVCDFDCVQVIVICIEWVVSDVVVIVDVIDCEQMDWYLVQDIKDLLCYELGLLVSCSVVCFGFGSICICGLDGNCVCVQIDGIVMFISFNIGLFFNVNCNFIDLDMFKCVEIVCGLVSLLYGFDVFGGVVVFVIKDLVDYLKDGKDSYVGLKFGYDGEWKGLFGGVIGVFGGEYWSGMVNINYCQGQEIGNKGDVCSFDNICIVFNLQDCDGCSGLVKLVYVLSEDQCFCLIVEGNEDNIDINVLFLIDCIIIIGMKVCDMQNCICVLFVYEMDVLDKGFVDSLYWQLYIQYSEIIQIIDEDCVNCSCCYCEFNFDQCVYGLQVQFNKVFSIGSVEYVFIYGFEGVYIEICQKCDGYQVLVNGQVSIIILFDVFLVCDFLISKIIELGLYVQDEMCMVDGRLLLVLGVCVDCYELKLEVDSIFVDDNFGVVVVRLIKISVLLKLGMVYCFSDEWLLFVGYLYGFCLLLYNDVNLGFINFVFGYIVIFNLDLKLEISDGMELGLCFLLLVVYVSVSGYYNEYKDFIELQLLVGINVQGLMVFQLCNIVDVCIYGVELKVGVDFGQINLVLQGWVLCSLVVWLCGDNRIEDMLLDLVDLLCGIVGLMYDIDIWGVELVGIFVKCKDCVIVVMVYCLVGYGVVDLMVYWNFVLGVIFNVGVFNLGDKCYIDWFNVGLMLLLISCVLDCYISLGCIFFVSFVVFW